MAKSQGYVQEIRDGIAEMRDEVARTRDHITHLRAEVAGLTEVVAGLSTMVKLSQDTGASPLNGVLAELLTKVVENVSFGPKVVRESKTFAVWATAYDHYRKIPGIKAIRHVSAMGLKEAKDFIEKLDFRQAKVVTGFSSEVEALRVVNVLAEDGVKAYVQPE